MNNFTTKDLHKIIDDAMAKKDREVTIFISKDHTHITVSPHTDSKPRWIEDESVTFRHRSRYKCSECGAWHDIPAPFCPFCGEKLALPIKEDKEATDDGVGD